MFVELHMIQSFSPANLNRDDTNNPKDCEFGGVRRARISSQCIKRAIRNSPVFAETTGVDVGTRTKRLIALLGKQLEEAGKDAEQATAILTEFVPKYASKLDKDGTKTAVLLYLSKAEIADITKAILHDWDALINAKTRDSAIAQIVKDLVKKHRGITSAPDIALFGRMLAEKPELGLNAACQVAHAISTHRVTMEMDFYTAVDDLNPDDTAGAGMMGFTGFDSACFYRYARVDWRQLVSNLDGDSHLACRTVAGFLRAAVAAVPTGKQNAFAAYNPPSFVFAVVRRDGMAWSLANAFERPVVAHRGEGLVAASMEALDRYWGQLCAAFGAESLVVTAALSVDPEVHLPNLQESLCANLDELVSAVLKALPCSEGVP